MEEQEVHITSDAMAASDTVIELHAEGSDTVAETKKWTEDEESQWK